ncbi:hypothetical protein GGX14DRAFT_538239 [Mycena pura]|uniref:Uncharacterized protein n=1 Tax=Mycena pura TaxID=153505 RepID=A0AAD6UNV1_9AGAR|nr:hypothetical protein GGX14DRAFT_538239 [Mycena pura]
MLLDILDNLPRCRFTGAQLSLVIHFAKSLGAPNVPSLKSLRRVQKSLQDKCSQPPLQINSAMGNIFFMNDLRQSIARDFSNPLVAPYLQLYPEEVDGDISEMWQAERWKEYSPEQLTPMFPKGHKQFWIEELAQTQDGTFVIPTTWIKRKGILITDALVVIHLPDGRWQLTERESIVEADNLQFDFKDLVAQYGDRFEWTDSVNVPFMPNKLRDLVEDDENLLVVMVMPWADDVSGNKSKQYNKHMNMYAQNGCLPGRLLQQEFHMHFVSTSPHASSAEQFAALRDHVKETEKNPIRTYNAATQRPCRVILRVPVLPADNPQQSEEASHMGSQANYPCRKCHWGGTKKNKETGRVYHDCHLAGIARNAGEIRDELQKQLDLATRGEAKAIEARQKASGTKDKRATTMREENPRRSVDEISRELKSWLDGQLGDKMNPLLDITGLDPSQDTPVELLHTILLGVIKYIWHFLNTERWKDIDRHLLAIRLQSTDLSGLSVPPYKNNLIGKHFKTLMQILALHDLQLIVAAGDLGARLWAPDLDIATANALDAWDALHLLTHLPKDIRRFGPAIRFSTEVFEANHIAPSRDIAQKFTSMDRVKHLLCGGFWWNAPSKSWSQARSAVLRRHLGWPGFIRLASEKKHPQVKWHTTQASKAWISGDRPAPESTWKQDRVPKLGWVFAHDGDGKLIFGRIAEILVGEYAIITLEQFVCGEKRHPDFGWPVARRPRGEDITRNHVKTHVVLKPTDLQFIFSVQHDCRKGKCQPAVVGKQRQERQETTLDRELIKHTDDDSFVINMAALHNFVQLHKALPKTLTELKYLQSDREKFHHERAAENREKTAAKRRATAAAKKKQAETAAMAAATAEKRATDAETAIAEGREFEPDEEDETEVEEEIDREASDPEDDADVDKDDVQPDDDYVPSDRQKGRGSEKKCSSASEEEAQARSRIDSHK